jgi:cytochrome c oxidase subunit 4
MQASASHIVPARIYFAIFLGLMGLTAITVAVAFVDLGRLNDVVALTIAVIKAVLVVLYFMHVRYSSRLTWLVVGTGFVWLLVLIGFTLSDYFSRDWLSRLAG